MQQVRCDSLELFTAFLKTVSFNKITLKLLENGNQGPPVGAIVAFGEVRFALHPMGSSSVCYIPLDRGLENSTSLAALSSGGVLHKEYRSKTSGTVLVFKAPGDVTVVFVFVSERVGKGPIDADINYIRLIMDANISDGGGMGSGGDMTNKEMLNEVLDDVKWAKSEHSSPRSNHSDSHDESDIINPMMQHRSRRSRSPPSKIRGGAAAAAAAAATEWEGLKPSGSNASGWSESWDVNEGKENEERDDVEVPIDEEEDDDDDFDIPEGTLMPNIVCKMHMGEKLGYQYIDPNSCRPIEYESEYFKGRVLLLMRMDDRPIEEHPYGWRFDGQKYQFEVQAQGTFKKVPPKGDFLFIGAEITRKMTLGLITRGMCGTVLQIGRTINRWLHHSFGDDKDMELPHICGPMWSALDHLIITRKGDTPPTLGTNIKEDLEQKKARRADPEYDVGIDEGDTTFTMTFKSSNLNLNGWCIENMPLLTGTSLHTFWGDASLRIGTWLVPRTPDMEMVGKGSDAMPKYHKQATNQYLFSVEVQHVSNLSEEELADVERHMLEKERRRERRRARAERTAASSSAAALSLSPAGDDTSSGNRNGNHQKAASPAFSPSTSEANSPMLNLSMNVSPVVSPPPATLSPPTIAVIKRRRQMSFNSRQRRTSWSGKADGVSSGSDGEGDHNDSDGDDDDEELLFYDAFASEQELEQGATAATTPLAASAGAAVATPNNIQPHGNPALLAAAQARFQAPQSALKSIPSWGSSLSAGDSNANNIGNDNDNDNDNDNGRGSGSGSGSGNSNGTASTSLTNTTAITSAAAVGGGMARYVLAVVEVDEARFLKTRTSTGGTGRRVLYVFAKPRTHIQEQFPFVLRTYREFCEAFPLYKMQRGKGGVSSGGGKRSKITAGLKGLASRASVSMGSAGSGGSGSGGDIGTRLAESEARRQNLELSYRTLLSTLKTQDEAGLRKITRFLQDDQHNDSFLEKKQGGGGVGSKRLRQGLDEFSLEGYVCVQLGNFHYSEEYLGLTQHSLVFIKPSGRLGSPKKLSLPLVSIMAVRAVEDADMPFSLPGVHAFSISTFSRHFVVMTKGGTHENWVTCIAQAVIDSKRAAGALVTRSSVASSGESISGGVAWHNSPVAHFHRHLDLMVKPKGLGLGGRLVLNARSFVRDGYSLYKGPDGDSKVWSDRSIELWLAEPHLLVEELLRSVLRLATIEQEREGSGSGYGRDSSYNNGRKSIGSNTPAKGDSGFRLSSVSAASADEEKSSSSNNNSRSSSAAIIPTPTTTPTTRGSTTRRSERRVSDGSELLRNSEILVVSSEEEEEEGVGDTQSNYSTDSDNDDGEDNTTRALDRSTVTDPGADWYSLAGHGEDEDVLQESESAWIDFMNGLALLQAVDITTVDPTLSEDSTLCLLLNLYHTMLVHAFLVMGKPDGVRAWGELGHTASYEAFGDLFSLFELERAVIKKEYNNHHNQGRSAHVAGFLNPLGQQHQAGTEKYAFAVKRGSDLRLLLALRHGQRDGGTCVPVYRPSSLDEQLDVMAAHALRGVTVSSSSIGSGGRDTVLLLPNYLEGYAPPIISGDTAGGGLGGDTHSDSGMYVSEVALAGLLAKYLDPDSEACACILDLQQQSRKEMEEVAVAPPRSASKQLMRPSFTGSEMTSSYTKDSSSSSSSGGGSVKKAKRVLRFKFEPLQQQFHTITDEY